MVEQEGTPRCSGAYVQSSAESRAKQGARKRSRERTRRCPDHPAIKPSYYLSVVWAEIHLFLLLRRMRGELGINSADHGAYICVQIASWRPIRDCPTRFTVSETYTTILSLSSRNVRTIGSFCFNHPIRRHC